MYNNATSRNLPTQMASFVRNNPINIDNFKIDVPSNESSPIRIAVLGDVKTGKTSFISKLVQGVYTDTYYPTIRINSSLLTFHPESDACLKILNPQFNNFHSHLFPHYNANGSNNKIVFSQLLTNVFNRPTTSSKRGRTASDGGGTEIVIHSKNKYYRTFSYKDEITKQTEPHITPILVELIDTPAFKSDVVPFLESSLYMELDKSILKNLANEPRRDVLTMPLLVASGAGELNGAIDGYFLVYSAIPSYNPPSYEEIINPSSSSAVASDSLLTLKKIKSSLEDAWKEFYTFKKNWNEGKEADIYSIKDALKTIFSTKEPTDESSLMAKRKFYTELLPNPSDPSDPYSPPPIWIICTHCNSALASQILILNGKETARNWHCGFISVDVTTDDLDIVVSLMIRDVVERKQLQKLKDAHQ